MLTLPSRVRVFVASDVVDFRRGIDSLYALVRDGFAEDAFSGDLFAFFNRARDRIKILVFDRNGFWLHLKRLERGTFESLDITRATHGRIEIDALRLQLLLEGIELRSAKSKKHFVREIRLNPRNGDERRTHGFAVAGDRRAQGGSPRA
jgi:transposase